MPSSKKIDLERDFAADVYLSEAPSPPLDPKLALYPYTGKALKKLE
jgi:hypothetical protein